MKKRNILIGTIISFVLTFILAELFSIYHFGSIPTLLTLFYLIAIFSIFEYVLYRRNNIYYNNFILSYSISMIMGIIIYLMIYYV